MLQGAIFFKEKFRISNFLLKNKGPCAIARGAFCGQVIKQKASKIGHKQDEERGIDRRQAILALQTIQVSGLESTKQTSQQAIRIGHSIYR